jgi:hypothetical protein
MPPTVRDPGIRQGASVCRGLQVSVPEKGAPLPAARIPTTPATMPRVRAKTHRGTTTPMPLISFEGSLRS